MAPIPLLSEDGPRLGKDGTMRRDRAAGSWPVLALQGCSIDFVHRSPSLSFISFVSVVSKDCIVSRIDSRIHIYIYVCVYEIRMLELSARFEH